MKCRTLGNSGLQVFPVGLGCMGLSQSCTPFLDKKEAIAFLRRAVEMGENFFDTSELYGMYDNEELVGEALEPVRDQVVIAVKFGWDIQDGKCLGLDRDDSKGSGRLHAPPADWDKLEQRVSGIQICGERYAPAMLKMTGQ